MCAIFRALPARWMANARIRACATCHDLSSAVPEKKKRKKEKERKGKKKREDI